MRQVTSFSIAQGYQDIVFYAADLSRKEIYSDITKLMIETAGTMFKRIENLVDSADFIELRHAQWLGIYSDTKELNEK